MLANNNGRLLGLAQFELVKEKGFIGKSYLVRQCPLFDSCMSDTGKLSKSNESWVTSDTVTVCEVTYFHLIWIALGW